LSGAANVNLAFCLLQEEEERTHTIQIAPVMPARNEDPLEQPAPVHPKEKEGHSCTTM
jgi:hypothetical protein